MIQITPAATQEIKRVQQSRGQEQNSLRLSIRPGGCADWIYHIDFASGSQPGDRTETIQDLTLLIDETSYPHLEHLTLDYSEDLMGGGFRFSNPAILKSCSCGQSFKLPTNNG